MSRTNAVIRVLVPLGLVLACARESREPVAPPVQAMSFAGSDWSTAVLVESVNSPFTDQSPVLSNDELSLYFQSNRPDGFGLIDLWVSQRDCVDCAWGSPQNLGPTINGPGAEFAPNLSPDGHLLFFSSNRPGGQGLNDIWVSHRTDTHDDFAWEPPVNLGPDVNTADVEQAPMYLQSAEQGPANLYFNRGANATNSSDLYYVAVSRDGETLGPAVLVTELDMPSANDARAAIRADGREIFFWSSRAGGAGGTDIWTATRQDAHDPWSAPVDAAINTPSDEVTPALSHDGRTLLFSSNRPGSTPNAAGAPSFDIWMAVRTPSGH
jgi:hypothetical protein